MAVKRFQKVKQDDLIASKDLFRSNKNMWPRTREELIERQRPRKDGDDRVLAMAVYGDPPKGEEPHGDTDGCIWTVEEITPKTPGCDSPYRRIVCAQIVNPAPGVWLAHWKGTEGTCHSLSCPPEFFQLVPQEVPPWREKVKALAYLHKPSVLDLGDTGITGAV